MSSAHITIINIYTTANNEIREKRKITLTTHDTVNETSLNVGNKTSI